MPDVPEDRTANFAGSHAARWLARLSRATGELAALLSGGINRGLESSHQRAIPPRLVFAIRLPILVLGLFGLFPQFVI
jgi:hypothetical protein